jgi:cytochrome b pre-mRNA-processing protein 3
MIWPFKKRFAPSAGVYAVYDAIVAQSRQEKFYAEWDVSDTVTGRFDMICLHMALVLHRLRAEQEQFSQDLFDLFFMDMDRSLREMGVGDISVPKRITKMGGVFYGLLEKLTEAFDNDDEEALAQAIRRNVAGAEKSENALELADYLQKLRARLAKQSPQDIVAGNIDLKEAL